MNTTTCYRCHNDFPDNEMLPLDDGGELCPHCVKFLDGKYQELWTTYDVEREVLPA